MAKQGITKNQHAVIHTWLRRKFGAANKCENPNCAGRSIYFQWSLIKGRLYEKNRGNFQMLCASCHVSYDWDEDDRQYMRNLSRESIEKIRAKNKGKKRTPEQIIAMSERMTGDKNPMFGRPSGGPSHPMFGKQMEVTARRKMFMKKAAITEERYLEIKELYTKGVKQKEIAPMFNLSRASVCRIINNKRYKLW